MYNWSTDEEYLKKFPEEYEKWRLLQLINYGLDGEKLDLTLLRKHRDEIRDDVLVEEKIEYIERFILCLNDFINTKKKNLLAYAVAKLHSILTKIKSKSFVDFYEIMKSDKKFTLTVMLEGLKNKYGYTIDPIFLAESLMKITKIHVYNYYDHKEEMVAYFVDLAKQQRSKIVKE